MYIYNLKLNLDETMTSNLPMTNEQVNGLIAVLKSRFQDHMYRHPGMDWDEIQRRIENNPKTISALKYMEDTGGEPDVIGFAEDNNCYIFFDFSNESPSGRRSLCYDQEALAARKHNKPAGSAIEMARQMGIDLLSEDQYRELQQLGSFDTKTSSWLKTPEAIRKLGGAIFGDFRFGHVFIYHNGADSYYAARGFRGSLRV
ncbi:MAG TPA: DUF4256 domain-containing protein [Saprospiraceae bacterium]|nr:DUF4256 domain-containing protein [Saprospiraceae bacterium]